MNMTTNGNGLVERFGCSTIMFGGTLSEKLGAIAEAGFSCTEFTTRDLWEGMQGPDAAIEVLRGSGLLASTYQLMRDVEGAPADQRDHKFRIAEQVLEQAVMVGTDLAILCANVQPESSSEREVQLRDLRELGDRAAAHGVRVAYEPIGWARWNSDYRVAWDLIRAVGHPSIGIMLDSSHIGSLGLPFDDIRSINIEKVFLVEIADLPATNMDNAELSRHYRMLPGDGVLDLVGFVTLLEEMGYAGVYSLEVFSARMRELPPQVAAKQCFDALQGLFDRAGFGVAR